MKHKTEWRLYTIAQYEQEQEYLRKKHREGWKFVHVNLLGFYLFEQCEPDDVIYQIDYQQGEVTGDYIKLFEDCGWKHIQSCMGFQYFSRMASDSTEESGKSDEIFCDDESRFDMMKRIFRGRMRILLIMFFGTVIPQFAMNSIQAKEDVYKRTFAIIYYIIFVLYLFIFAHFGGNYLEYERKVNGEESNVQKKRVLFFTACVVLTLVSTLGLGWCL